MVPKILLADTTRWALGARLAIGLSKAGCEVSAVCPAYGHPLLKTRALKRSFPYSAFRPLDALTTAIAAVRPQIIIPCDDRAVQHLHELYAHASYLGTSGRSIANLIDRSLGPPESYPVVSARYELMRIAQEEGIRVPRTEAVHALADLESWRAREAFPWVLKADGTWGGSGVKIAYTLSQAERFYSDLNRLFGAKRIIKRLCVNRDPFWLRPWWNRAKPAVIVQSHIHGFPANCAVVCWKGKVLAGIGVEVVSAQGETGPASIVRVVENSDMMFAAERIVRRLCLSGFVGLDFMVEQGTGSTYLIEMNPRCTPLCHLRLGGGRDMVGRLSAQLSGWPYVEAPPVTESNMIAYFPQAWNCESELFQSSFQDVPEEEPELIAELLRPWPNRSLLFRMANGLHHVKSFAASIVTGKSISETR